MITLALLAACRGTEPPPPPVLPPPPTDCAGRQVHDGLLELTTPDQLAASGARLRGTTGDLAIHDVSGADDLRALACLSEVGGSLTVIGNPGLASLAGLPPLHLGPQGLVEIRADPALKRLDLTIAEARQLTLGATSATTLAGLVLPAELEYVFVADAGALRSTRGLSGLERVTADFSITFNPALEDLAGLDTVQVGPSVMLRGNPRLKRLGTLRMSADGVRLKIVENDALRTLDGLVPPRRLASAPLVLEANKVLMDLSALSGLEETDGVDIVGNHALTALTGLEGLRRSTGSVRVTGNRALRDVSALHGLQSIRGDLDLTGNPALPLPDREAVVEAIGRDHITGEVRLQ